MPFASLPWSPSRPARRLQPPRRGRQRGFTLLELTVAMSFVGLLASAIAISISTCLHVWQRSLETASLNEEARAIIEIISHDLRCAHLGLYRAAGFFTGSPAFQGDAPIDQLELCTQGTSVNRAALLPDEVRSLPQERRAPISDYIGVRYEWLEAQQNSAAGLYRITWVVPAALVPAAREPAAGPLNSELLSQAVTSLRFLYFDGQQWRPQYEAAAEESRLPFAVFIQITLLDERAREHEFQSIVSIPSR